VSTLSRIWVDETTKNGRFEGVSWNRTATVPLTTLDAAIARYGMPAFVKIDVEGFEYEVLKGLSTAVNALSIEFATETLANASSAIDHVLSLAEMRFQIVQGEATEFLTDGWMPAAAALEQLRGLCAHDALAWGDVYMRRA
jgi:hypothetical protein